MGRCPGDDRLDDINSDVGYFDGGAGLVDGRSVDVSLAWAKKWLDDQLVPEMNNGISRWRSRLKVFRHLVKSPKKTECVPMLVANFP